MNILEEFWYGNIEPAEYDTSSSEEYKELLQLISRNEDKLLATMTEDQKELFTKYADCVREYQVMAECLLFQNSFHIFYEKFKKYFESKGDPLSSVRSQQIAQAISKSKKPPESNVDKDANAYFNQYLLFQQEHYPTLDLRTSKKSSGWWPHYGTRLGDVYLYHKTQEGSVILIFPNSTQYMDVMQEIASWLRMHGVPNVSAKTASSSLALSVEVPQLKVKEPFELTSKADLKACFNVIQELSDFANIVAAAHGISAIKKQRKSKNCEKKVVCRVTKFTKGSSIIALFSMEHHPQHLVQHRVVCIHDFQSTGLGSQPQFGVALFLFRSQRNLCQLQWQGLFQLCASCLPELPEPVIIDMLCHPLLLAPRLDGQTTFFLLPEHSAPFL